MEKRIVECVPNFSEGRDKEVIRRIVEAIEGAGGVKVLDVDPGEATNRTVVTFVGAPEEVVEAAFAGVKRASELIDMRQPQRGRTPAWGHRRPAAHSRFGHHARGVRRAGAPAGRTHRLRTADSDLLLRGFGSAAERRNLAVCRAGEYEALPEKLAHAETAPDFGARPFDEGVARTEPRRSGPAIS